MNACYHQTQEEGERGRVSGQGREPSTLTSWEQVVDFSQTDSGQSRQVEETNILLIYKVLLPSICLIALEIPKAKTHFL